MMKRLRIIKEQSCIVNKFLDSANKKLFKNFFFCKHGVLKCL